MQDVNPYSSLNCSGLASIDGGVEGFEQNEPSLLVFHQIYEEQLEMDDQINRIDIGVRGRLH